MYYRTTIGAVALAASLCGTFAGALAFDESKYPNWKGAWRRVAVPGIVGQPSYDPTKLPGAAQQAPLTPEYQAIYEANVKDQALGGQGTDPTYTCLSPGMPRVMTTFVPFEILVTPQMTNFLIQHIHDSRRIFTDGRDWPKNIVPTFVGYSIGHWIDSDGDGRYDVLEIETRGFKGPRSYDPAGIPLAFDNQSIFKERIYSDKADPNILYDEITTIDNALTRPWTVTKKYVREPKKDPVWRETVCAEGNQHVLDRGNAVVFCGERQRMIDVMGELRFVLLFLAEPVERVDGGPAVGAIDPGHRCPPLELSDFRSVGQRGADAEQCADIHTVVNRHG